MSSRTYCVLLMIVGISAPLLAQAPPWFEPPVKLCFSDGSDLLPGGTNYYATPTVADWNGDGVLDLVSGYFYNGSVYVYINSGSNEAPVFRPQSGAKLYAGGSFISVGYG